jgi:hypothetical protein
MAICGLSSLTDRHGYLLLAPTAVSTWRPVRAGPPRLPGRMALLNLAAILALAAAEYGLAWPALLRWTRSPLLLGYAAIPVMLTLVRATDLVMQMTYALLGRDLPPMHDRPLTSANLADFWGKRWNRWINDWFRELASTTPGLPRSAKVLAVFAISGLLHEAVINLPLALLGGTRCFGTMLGFFAASAVGVFVDRKLPQDAAVPRFLWLWAVLLATAPLFMNEATLRIMHLWPRE